jgi:hypothetical protein
LKAHLSRRQPHTLHLADRIDQTALFLGENLPPATSDAVVGAAARIVSFAPAGRFGGFTLSPPLLSFAVIATLGFERIRFRGVMVHAVELDRQGGVR